MFTELLNNYWITYKSSPQDYLNLRESLSKYKEFIQEKLGYKIIERPEVIKLEKIPGEAEAWMGIQDFESNEDYVFFTLLLMYLEDKSKGEKFLLSYIADYLKSNYVGEFSLKWTDYQSRRSLVRVLKYAEEMEILRAVDGISDRFGESEKNEVLYENTGLSKYFMRTFSAGISEFSSLKDFEEEAYNELTDPTKTRRNRVYRKLLLSPAVYTPTKNDDDFNYIKNFYPIIKKDFEKILGYELRVYKGMAIIVYDFDNAENYSIPENKTISDICLLVNGGITEGVEAGDYEVDELDVITITKHSFNLIIEETRRRYGEGWSKAYREMNSLNLIREVIEHMKSYRMIEEGDSTIRLMPLVGLITGKYIGL